MRNTLSIPESKALVRWLQRQDKYQEKAKMALDYFHKMTVADITQELKKAGMVAITEKEVMQGCGRMLVS